MSSPEPGLLAGYRPPLSLWRLVEQHVAVHELGEIKNMLGEDIIEETLELHMEIEALLDIWRDCREQSEHKSYDKPHGLPEPPGMRDRLIQEIRFFVENVKEKAQDQGRDESELLGQFNQNVIEYTTNSSRSSSIEPNSRAQSVMGKDGRETPAVRFNSPISDRVSSSSYSTVSEDVEAMSDKLNILKLDEVIQHLRSFLTEEKEHLIQDLRFLQQCIEDEAALEKTLMPEEPSISELREERLKLEKDMLADVFINQRPLSATLENRSPVMRTLNSAKTRAPVVPCGAPLKAVHTTAPDGIVLQGNVPESVIHKTQLKLHEVTPDTARPSGSAKQQTRLVKLGSIKTNPVADSSLPANHRETVCSTSAVRRSASAMKFRSMVLNTRSDEG